MGLDTRQTGRQKDTDRRKCAQVHPEKPTKPVCGTLKKRPPLHPKKNIYKKEKTFVSRQTDT